MILRIRNSRSSKVIAMALIISFFSEVIFPGRAVALTGGPGQPEMAGFTPLDTGNLVDLFSGDFRYNILVMTVPGPNGGYPINLNYLSNAGMEHEASWVGLGWNLNPGAINRQVRGLPDDFQGDRIEKVYKRRDNNTFIFHKGVGGEVYGADFGVGVSLTDSYTYNTFRGISISKRFGLSLSYVRDAQIKSERNKIATGSFGFSLDSDNGISTSFGINGGSKLLKLGVHYGYNSKSGTYTYGHQVYFPGAKLALGSSFSTAASLPPIKTPVRTSSNSASVQTGGSGAYLEGYGSLAGDLCIQKTSDDTYQYKAYGLLYSEQADRHSLRDFNREKEIVVDQNSKNLPLPVMTHDIYTVNGEILNGAFRAYRSDFGHFSDHEVKTTYFKSEIGTGYAMAAGLQGDLSIAVNAGESTVGDWSGLSDNLNLRYRSKDQYATSSNKNISPALYEPFYFKMSGELTATDPGYLKDIGGTPAIRFAVKRLSEENFFGQKTSRYLINNEISTGSNGAYITAYTLAQRMKRSNLIEYQTSSQRRGHIAEFSITNTEGERFTYGKALYNHEEKEVMFSIPFQYHIDSTTTSAYSWANASGTGRVGKERLYSMSKIPAYAYSYLITSITSPDYVDADNIAGPSDGDFGYWVKFSYLDKYRGNDLYQWRFPYKGVNRMMGDPSNETDDLGTYYYGRKEISYLQTIETKTHIAIFHCSPREDGYEAKDEIFGGFGGTNNRTLNKLDSIVLYSKMDRGTPIRTAIFEYDYSLCQGIPNSGNGQGKLTLRSLRFKNYGSEKGMDNPYSFRYDNSGSFTYNPSKMDRWGNLKPDASYFEHYVTQDKASAGKSASAWLLNYIGLPSGGSIDIEYEPDDYAYVQDKQAMYMAKISKETTFKKESGKYYVYFEKDKDYPVSEYLKGFKNNLMFFKIAVRAKKGLRADYVQGYVRINPSRADDYGTTARVEARAFPAYDMHPIHLICCQYLKNNRPDILFNNYDVNENQSDLIAFIRSIFSSGMISEYKTMYGNDKFYKHCIKKNLYNGIVTDNSRMPSYVRLNVPSKVKYGGGARVRKVTTSDRWEKSPAASYTQEYFYRKLEGDQLISSGVAEYEPTVGGEENALRYPVYDQAKHLFFIEDEIYSEEPYGESYFPAANVGYSQVVVKSSVPSDAGLSASGIQVAQFYTARDFPVTVSQTPIYMQNDNLPGVVSIPTAGFKQSSRSVFSQGYQVELNDMHGKQKLSATYPFFAENDTKLLLSRLKVVAPVSKTEYHYKSKTEAGKKKVDNLVDVLYGHGIVKKEVLGQTFDFTVDQRENKSQNEGGGTATQFMMGIIWTPPTPGGSGMVSYDCFDECVRSVATTKVLYNSGILEKIVTINNGSKIITQHLAWDPYTGQPLQSTVTNEFDQPVYHYSMPAYWYYENMGSAAENYRAVYKSSYNLRNDEVLRLVRPYDCFYSSGTLMTVKECTFQNNRLNVSYWDPNGNNLTLSGADNIEVIRSRRSNQLSAIANTLTSLSEPFSTNGFPLFETFNAFQDTCFLLNDCTERKAVIIKYHEKAFHFFAMGETEKIDDYCAYSYEQLVNVPNIRRAWTGQASFPSSHATDYSFTKSGNNAVVTQLQPPYTRFTVSWNDPEEAFNQCLEDVLQASAIQYYPAWAYSYYGTGSSLTAGRQEYLRLPNIFRSLRSNVIVDERKQSGSNPAYHTNMAIDGTFRLFAFFDHLAKNDRPGAPADQAPWKWNQEITRYSPLGFETENKNALNIYSSALYGYNHAVPVAVANNARYQEIGFESFETEAAGSSASSFRNGQLQLNMGSVSEEGAHTGKKALRTGTLSTTFNVVYSPGSGVPDNGRATLLKGKKYIFSCWSKSLQATPGKPVRTIYLNGQAIGTVTIEESVEKWDRIEFGFTIPSGFSGDEIVLTIIDSYRRFFLYDDIRVFPFNATMKSYVYRPADYLPVAELDENNFATFYNYDLEGLPVQVKKETEQGIRTLSVTRQHLRKNSTNP